MSFDTLNRKFKATFKTKIEEFVIVIPVSRELTKQAVREGTWPDSNLKKEDIDKLEKIVIS